MAKFGQIPGPVKTSKVGENGKAEAMRSTVEAADTMDKLVELAEQVRDKGAAMLAAHLNSMGDEMQIGDSLKLLVKEGTGGRYEEILSAALSQPDFRRSLREMSDGFKALVDAHEDSIGKIKQVAADLDLIVSKMKTI